MITIELPLIKLILILLLIMIPSIIFSVSYMIHTITEMKVAKRCIIQVEKAKENERR